jgi:hypothetical protein
MTLQRIKEGIKALIRRPEPEMITISVKEMREEFEALRELSGSMKELEKVLEGERQCEQ